MLSGTVEVARLLTGVWNALSVEFDGRACAVPSSSPRLASAWRDASLFGTASAAYPLHSSSAGDEAMNPTEAARLLTWRADE